MPAAERYHQYEVLRREDGSLWELGRGAMGITYKAYDTNLRFTVALKVINSAYLESDTARQRFLREARAAAALRHSNVASVFNLGTEQDNYFYVMEFIDGETVEARVKRQGPLEPVEALKIGLQVARALAVAARQQLVHRDLKPTNLMLVDQEGEQIVKVIDFGLAKVPKDSGEDSGALTVGGFVGTPHFASPEQIEEGELDIRSDIYSLGVTLYFVLTGQSPFSGSVGQVMSQQLYKPLPIALLASLPPCVVSLLQHMMEKDPNNRPQTPQDLQKDILTCLEAIQHSAADMGPRQAGATAAGAFETVDLSSTSSQPPGVGAVLAHNYKLIEELVESPQGRKFLADDLRRKRRVSLLVLSPEFLSDVPRLASLKEAVQLLRNAPHPMLREIYSLETVTDCSFLVEEYFVGPSLLDVLRARSVLSAPEVVRLLSLLAPLADHAGGHQLQHLDLTLSGIHLTYRASTVSGIQPDLLQRPLTAWEPLEAKVDAIKFSFLPSDTATWAGSATRIQGAADSSSRGSCVRLLSLLAYELLGGPRTRVESTGKYTPIAALTQEGNAALRRALVDECPSAGELARQLAAALGVKGPAPPVAESTKRVAPEPLPRGLPPEPPADVPIKPASQMSAWRLVLALGLIALMAIGGYVISRFQPGPPITGEIAELSVQTEPAGASVLLDGKPARQPPGAFTHVPFGKHRLTAALDGYEPFTRDIQVREGMDPTIPVKLQPRPPEIAALSVQTEPAGASVLLDGKPPRQPPGAFTHVSFGKHQLTAVLDGYEPVTLDLQVLEGMDPTIPVKLPQSDKSSPQYLTAYVRFVQSLRNSGATNFEEHLKKLERITDQLRTKTPPLSRDDFRLSYKKSIRDAANLDIHSAILLLGENENDREAIQWFLHAVDLWKDSYAMMKVGRLYLKKRTPEDKEKGLEWLNRAYDAPNRNLEAGSYIGDCYFSGIGTKQDVQKAEEIIMPLANQNVVPAMTLAGRILQYKAATGGKAQANELDRSARQWWERAEKDDWNAAAHLGKCYEEGWGGVEKSEEEAEKRYKAGRDHGNALSMFFYGLMLEKKRRHSEAVALMSQAAAKDLPSAITWCRDNKLPIPEIKPDDELQ
jgi:serine/threonine protein kinase/TPR repeat protein